MLVGKPMTLAVREADAAQMRARLDGIERLLEAMGATSMRRNDLHQLVGEMRLGNRAQPFTVFLRSLRGKPILRCISPVGRFGFADWDDDIAADNVNAPFTRIAIETNEKFMAYDVAIEGDVLLGAKSADKQRGELLIGNVIRTADNLEQLMYDYDARLNEVDTEINLEASVAR
jgi:hypothetical protein